MMHGAMLGSASRMILRLLYLPVVWKKCLPLNCGPGQAFIAAGLPRLPTRTASTAHHTIEVVAWAILPLPEEILYARYTGGDSGRDAIEFLGLDTFVDQRRLRDEYRAMVRKIEQNTNHDVKKLILESLNEPGTFNPI